MEQNSNRKFESIGRVGIRNKETNEIIGVYPYKVHGNDYEIEDKVKSWFFPNANEEEKHFTNGFVDSLSYKEIMNAKDIFID